jgi:hypothetical protein
MLCHRASSLDVLKHHSSLFFRVQQSRRGLAKLFEGACPNCSRISKKFSHMPVGNLKWKIRSLSLPLSIALILMHIIIYNKSLMEEWDRKKCFKEIVKRFVQCHGSMNSSLKRGPIGCSETSVRNYRYSLCTNPGEHISEGTVVLWNTRIYWPNDTVSHPRILEFSVSPLWETKFSYFIVILIISVVFNDAFHS